MASQAFIVQLILRIQHQEDQIESKLENKRTKKKTNNVINLQRLLRSSIFSGFFFYLERSV